MSVTGRPEHHQKGFLSPTTEGQTRLRVMPVAGHEGSRAPGRVDAQPWLVFYPRKEADSETGMRMSGWGCLKPLLHGDPLGLQKWPLPIKGQLSASA